MMLKISSLIGYGTALLGFLFLFEKNYILSYNPIIIIIQLGSIALMIWARIIFGLRSFHVTANTTKGELVTTGPYRWLRHPIYAAIMYFAFAAIISYPFIDAIAAFMLISAGLLFRIVLEEKELLKTYDNYAEYSKHAKRIIPFIY